MPEIKLAVLSDIHGNRWALEAVLRDIERRGISDIVNLGDSLYGPLDPAGTARRLLPLRLPTVQGNEDRIIVDTPPEWADADTLRFVKESLDPEHLLWLEGLCLTTTAHEHFHLCHGTLERDDEYLLHEVSRTGVIPRKPKALAAKLASLQQPVLLCGHDHTPRTVRTPDGRLIVNPGSVGLPAYTDDLPFPHAMGTGTLHARYAVVSGAASAWKVEDVALQYDWESAAHTASRNGRPDWAAWLQTGLADPSDKAT